MLSKNLFSKMYLIAIVGLLQIILISCGDNFELTENDLEIRDNIIYQRGKNTPFTGIERTRVQDKIIEYEIVDGIKHGNFRLYFDNGNLEIDGKIEQNINTGLWKYFYETGELESEGYFVEDLPEGRWVWYYQSGEIKEEGSFHKGKRVAWWYQYNPDGTESNSKNFNELDSLETGHDTEYNTIEKYEF